MIIHPKHLSGCVPPYSALATDGLDGCAESVSNASGHRTEVVAGTARTRTSQHHPVWIRFTVALSCVKLAVRVAHQVQARCTIHTHALRRRLQLPQLTPSRPIA